MTSEKGRASLSRYNEGETRKKYLEQYYQTDTYKKIRRHSVRTYRAKKRKLLHGFTKKEWEKKLKDSKGFCFMCWKHVGKKNLELDHIFPISKAKEGFVYTIDDVQPLCPKCNRSKGNKPQKRKQ